MPEAAPEDIKSERYIEIYDWLHRFTLGPAYQTLLKVWSLVTPRIWEGYERQGIKGLQEQILLEKAQIAIRKAWKQNRPFFFGRKFKVKDGSPENQSPENNPSTEQNGDCQVPAGGGVQSEGTRAAARNRRHRKPRVLRDASSGVSPDGKAVRPRRSRKPSGTPEGAGTDRPGAGD